MSVQRLDRASSALGMSVIVVEAVQLALWLVAPQALAPLLASLVIAQLGGYGVLFAVAGLFTVLGAASVGRIRSVR